MPDRTGRSIRSTHTWRGRPGGKQLSTESRWTARAVATLLGLGLIGLLAWALWWWMFLPRVHIFGLPVVHYDALAVPPVPFAEDDVTRLTSPPPAGPKSHSRQSLLGLETSQGMATLSSALGGVVTRPGDVVILYLCGHGVSEGGKPLLLCSNYLPADNSGRIELSEVLRQASACRARLKLVLLDTGWIAADPRQGMLVNEFSRLLGEEVKKQQDDGLWVLVSHGPLETSYATYPDQASVFGHFVTEGLIGSADTDADHVVELAEFYAYVRQRVASRVFRQTAGAATQTPELFRGKTGPAKPEEGIALVSVAQIAGAEKQAASPEQPETQAQPPAGKATFHLPAGAGRGRLVLAAATPLPAAGSGDRPEHPESPGQPSQGDSPRGPAKGQETENKPVAMPPDAPAIGPPAARGQVLTLLAEAWTLRDQLQSRESGANWTPVDYAPHLWREFQELLLGYEMQFRDRGASAAEDLSKNLKMLIDSLRCLAEDRPFPPATDPSSVLARLDRARREAVGRLPPADGRDASQLAVAYGEAIRLRNDLLFACPYYFRWYGRAARGAPFAASLHDHLSQLLADQMPQHGGLLAATANTTSVARADKAELDSRLRQIQLSTAALKDLRGRIERDVLSREVEAILGESEEARKPGESSQRIVDLLTTPLLPATRRVALLRILEGLRGRSAGDVDPAAPPATASSPRAWGAALGEAELAWQLVQLLDPSSAKLMQEDLALLRARSSQQGETEEAGLWEAYRSLGGRLGEFYRGLPRRIRDELASTDAAAAGRVELLLRAVDARDAVRVPAEACRWSIQPPPDFRLPEEHLELTGPERLEIDPNLWTEFSVAAQAAGVEKGAANLALEYDRELLLIERTDHPGNVQPGQAMPVASTGEQPATFAFRVRCAAKRAPGETATLAVQLTSGQAARSHRIQLVVRLPDTVELQVAGTGLTVDRRAGQQGGISLRPFPNRTTQFRLDLVNRSGKTKKVSVVLLGSPPGDLTRAASAAENRQQELAIWKQDGRVLAGPLAIELPADQKPVPIPFPPPEKPAPSSEGSAPKGPEQPAKAANPVEITKGLVCLIREGQEKEWAHWVTFASLFPRDYLEPIVSYRAANQRLSIKVQAKDLDGDGQPDPDILPPVGPEEPIRVKWETAGVLDPNTEMNDQGRITVAGQSFDLFAVVEPAPGRVIPVRLTVDEWRQAFLYQAVCDRDRPRIDREGSVRSVAIRSPQPDAAFLAPLDALPVELQVDAPDDAFQQPGDYVEVGIDANGDRLLAGEKSVRLYSDRAESVFLDKLQPGGLLRVAAKVGDLQVRLDPGGLRNVAVDILAQLSLRPVAPGGDRSEVQAAVRVVLDGAPPEVQVIVPDQPVPKGGPIAVSARTKDLSGVEKLEVGFDLDGSSDFEEKEAPKVLQQAGGAESWTTSLPTEKLEPGRYRLMVRATDRVGLSRSEFRQVSIAAPSGDAGPEAKKTSTIRGTVVLGNRPAAGITVQLQGTSLSAVSDSNGRFVLQKVPHGSYTLEAKGIALDRFRERSIPITLPAATEPAEIEVPLQ